MSAVESKKTWIQLQMSDPALGGVTLHSRDGDLLALSKQMVARLGQIACHIQEFEDQLAALRQELEKWASDRLDLVREVFLILKGDHFQFLVVLKDSTYNAELEDALTSLDISVARNRDFNLIRLSVLAIPAFGDDVVHSFLPQRDLPEDDPDHAR